MREVCPKIDVVVFQPWTLTLTHLGSCHLCLTLLIYSFYPNFSLYPFWIICLPLFTTASPSAAVHHHSPLVYTRLPPPLPVRSAAHLDVAYTLHQTDSVSHPCAPRGVPAPAVVSRVGLIPLLPPSAFTQVPVRPWGVCLLRFSLWVYIPASSYPSSPPNLGIVRSLVSTRWLFTKRRDI